MGARRDVRPGLSPSAGAPEYDDAHAVEVGHLRVTYAATHHSEPCYAAPGRRPVNDRAPRRRRLQRAAGRMVHRARGCGFPR
jgi:hypothetical protein